MTDEILMVGALVVGALACAWWLTGRLRIYALSAQILDVPNARSSHVTPTPRGGGVAIVLTFLTSLPVLYALGELSAGVAVAMFGGGVVVAGAGFADDRRHVPARWRLLAHFMGVLWVLVWLAPAIASPLSAVLPLAVAFPVLAIFMVWVLNLYNFMDGIDGIASLEAITVCVLGAALLWSLGQPGMAVLPLVLAACTAGFLIWNFPPARIFMGDAGSGFLGLIVGSIAVWCLSLGLPVFAAWVILLATFVADASVTLFRRALRGQRVWEAHRSHLYQRAARHFGQHLPVTLMCALVNLFWLGPIALLVAHGWVPVLIGLAVAYVPLMVVAWLLGAGQPDEVPLFGSD